jgi:hypothetical protein
MKANDVREVLWEGATGYVLVVYAQFFKTSLRLSSRIAVGNDVYVAIAHNGYSIGAGVIFLFVALILRQRRSRLELQNGARDTPLHRKIACGIALLNLVSLAASGWLFAHVLESHAWKICAYYQAILGVLAAAAMCVLALSLIWQGLTEVAHLIKR